MLYKIIGDSCMDLTEELKVDPHFQMIPLTLQIGDYKVTDDETFNQKEFLAKVKASSECPKTACPSPESFKEAFEGEAEYIFVVTLSNHLSGCYNSAALAKRFMRKRTERTGRRLQSLIPCRRRRAS
ncbi:DegV family protein [Clostridium sp. AF50-3]|uniref:DegV family protein n=1 Tax=Clostridium sp. AF50-3 TaxID=2293021 RepID=UPI0026C6C68E